MNSRSSAFAAPYRIIRRIRNYAPSRTISENWGRSGGFYGDEDETTSGYESVLIYVRRGLGRPEIIAPVIEFALKVQREYSARWTLIPLSYGWSDELKHMGTDIVMNRSMRADRSARCCVRWRAMSSNPRPLLCRSCSPGRTFGACTKGR